MSQAAHSLTEYSAPKVHPSIPRGFGYISLMKVPVFFSVGKCRMECLLEDFDTKAGTAYWKIQTISDPKFAASPELNLNGAYSLKLERFTFHVNIKDRNHSDLTTSLPVEILQLRSRSYERFKPYQNELIQAKLCFQDRYGTLQTTEVDIEGKNIRAWAEGGMGVLVPRESGLFLPGDLVTSIILTKKGMTLFEGQGVVVWSYQPEPFDGNWHLGIQFQVPEDKKSRSREMLEDETLLCERNLERIRLNGGISSAFIRAQHPFRENTFITGAVHDVTTHGLSFLHEERELNLPVGSVLNDVTLQLPFLEPMTIKLVLRNVSDTDVRNGGEVYQLKRYGFEFVDLSEGAFRSIERLIMETRNQALKEARVENLDELWKFFFDTGFIYDEKRRLLASRFDRIRESYERLLSEKNNVFKKIVYKRNAQVYAHVSALAHYDTTWLIQHLAASKYEGKSTSIEVVMAILDFFIQMYNELKPQASYIQFYYRPENYYPATVFGGALKRLTNPKRGLAFTYGYYLGITSTSDDSSLKIREAKGSEIDQFEKLVVTTLPPLQIRAEGLCKEEINIKNTQNSYRKFSLEKSRTLLTLPGVGFATVETSELGLNLSELTNVIRVFPFESHGVNPLVEQTWSWLNKNNMGYHTLLLRKEQEVDFSSSLFKKEKDYVCWMLESGAIREFKSIVIQIFSELKAGEKTPKAN